MLIKFDIYQRVPQDFHWSTRLMPGNGGGGSVPFLVTTKEITDVTLLAGWSYMYIHAGRTKCPGKHVPGHFGTNFWTKCP